MKALGLRIWAALFFPINWSMEPGIPVAVLMILYIGALVWLARSRPNRAPLVFALGFVIVSALAPPPSEGAFCPHCGKPMPLGAKFCASCGNKIG